MTEFVIIELILASPAILIYAVSAVHAKKLDKKAKAYEKTVNIMKQCLVSLPEYGPKDMCYIFTHHDETVKESYVSYIDLMEYLDRNIDEQRKLSQDKRKDYMEAKLETERCESLLKLSMNEYERAKKILNRLEEIQNTSEYMLIPLKTRKLFEKAYSNAVNVYVRGMFMCKNGDQSKNELRKNINAFLET